jgi:Ca2+/Na+ antiporter
MTINIDLVVLIIASLALFLSVFAGPHHRINRWEAAGFLVLYLGYTIYLFL